MSRSLVVPLPGVDDIDFGKRVKFGGEVHQGAENERR